MTVFSIIWLLAIAVVAVYPMVALSKQQRMKLWDYAYPFTGVVIWIPLAMTNIGSTVSLSNFVVEVFWIAVVSAVVPWLRWMPAHFKAQKLRTLSLLLTFLPVITAVVIRLMMPTLPE